jgi:hypothetical protein
VAVALFAEDSPTQKEAEQQQPSQCTPSTAGCCTSETPSPALHAASALSSAAGRCEQQKFFFNKKFLE